MKKIRRSAAADYESATPKQFGTLHERMKFLLQEARTAELWRTHGDVWTAIHDLETEVRGHEPVKPPFGSRLCQIATVVRFDAEQARFDAEHAKASRALAELEQEKKLLQLFCRDGDVELLIIATEQSKEHPHANPSELERAAPDPLTPEMLAELERLHAAATRGPWANKNTCSVFPETGLMIVEGPGTETEEEDRQSLANGDFIAAAHNHFSALLAAAREAARLQDAIAWRCASCGCAFPDHPSNQWSQPRRDDVRESTKQCSQCVRLEMAGVENERLRSELAETRDQEARKEGLVQAQEKLLDALTARVAALEGAP